MTKKQKPEDRLNVTMGSSVPPPDQININSVDTVHAPVSNLIGTEISLDLTRESYFGVGDIWLSPERYWCTVPDTLSPSEYGIIETAIRRGTLKAGKVYTPPIQKASNVLEKYWMLIAANGFENKKAKNEFAILLRKGQDQGWTAIEIVNFCLDKEKAGKNRKQVIALLTQVSKHYDGPVTLWDPPDTAEGIKKVTINADGTITAVTNSGTEVAKSLKETPPANHVKGSKSSEQAVNDIFK